MGTVLWELGEDCDEQLSPCSSELDMLVEPVHNTVHSLIEMSQVEASHKENENKVWINLYPGYGGDTLTPKLSVGDNYYYYLFRTLGATPMYNMKVTYIHITNNRT